jgi:predicted nucleotidyltransferase
MLTQIEIIEKLNSQDEALRRLGVKRLGLFGSFSRDEASATSDMDFVVEFERKTFDSYMDLKFFLEGLFQRGVDLVLEDGIKPRLRQSISCEVRYVPQFSLNL